MKKILFFIPNLCGGGAERVLVNLVNYMAQEKYKITVMTLFNEGPYIQALKDHIVYKYIFKKTIRGNTKILKLFSPSFLFRMMIREKYDMIVSYLQSPTTRIIGGCPYRDTKLVNWVHNEMLKETDFLASFRSKEERFQVFNRFDATVFVSNTALAAYERYFGKKDSHYVKYNTVETDLIKEKALEPLDIPYDPNKINLISVGRLTHQKGFERLLNIQKRLIAEGLSAHLYILGKGELESDFKAFIDKNQMEENTTLLGFQSNPYKYVKNADLFVCSSYHEGYSTAVTEALIVGTPVITTLCSGMDELLEGGKYGIITENSEEALYQELKKLLDDQDRLSHFKNMAAKRSAYFSTEHTVSEVQKLFDELLGDK